MRCGRSILVDLWKEEVGYDQRLFCGCVFLMRF